MHTLSLVAAGTVPAIAARRLLTAAVARRRRTAFLDGLRPEGRWARG